MCCARVVLPLRLRAIDLDHAAARDAADAQRNIERDRAGRDDSMLSRWLASPIFMIEPLPYLRSIWVRAADNAFSFSGEIEVAGAAPFCVATRAAPYVLSSFFTATRPSDAATWGSDSLIIARTFV